MSSPPGAEPANTAPMSSSSLVSQFARFLGVGLTGFVIDVGTTLLLVELGSPPWLARLVAIALAMVVTWLANGRFTFRRGGWAPAATFVPYLLVAAAAAAVNFGVFLALFQPLGSMLLAVVVATVISMIVSFAGFRLLVFGH